MEATSHRSHSKAARRASRRSSIATKKRPFSTSINPQNSEEDSDDDFDNELAIESKRAIAYLQTHRNYRYVDFLAQGGYGWVSLVYDDKQDRSLAVKCTTETTDMETGWWPKLQHKNILALIEYITLDSCTVFIMPAMRKDLWMCVSEEEFYHNELSFGLCRIWLGDVASALEYLHGLHLCHLDLKLDNVFLKHDGYACLGDFSLLSDTREVPSDFHFLDLYEPPEFTDWCHGTPPASLDGQHPLGGDKADMWQYGILALDLLTNLSLTRSRDSDDLTLWHHDVWPFVQKVLLHKEYLEYLLEASFDTVIFQEEELEQCHALLSGLLCMEPGLRMEAGEARKHEFLNTEWPQLPSSFTMPKVIVEHLSRIQRKSIGDIKLEAKESKTWEDVLDRQTKKLQNKKIQRRNTILGETSGKPLLNYQEGGSTDSNSSTDHPSTSSKMRPVSNVKTSSKKHASRTTPNISTVSGSVPIFLPKSKVSSPIQKQKDRTDSESSGFQIRLEPDQTPPATSRKSE